MPIYLVNEIWSNDEDGTSSNPKLFEKKETALKYLEERKNDEIGKIEYDYEHEQDWENHYFWWESPEPRWYSLELHEMTYDWNL